MASSSSSSSAAAAAGGGAGGGGAPAPIDALGDGSSYRLGRATKLMIAAGSGSKRTLDKVLAQGARVDILNEGGFSAMHFAAKSTGDAGEVIRELHARGLSVSTMAKGKWIESVQSGDGMQPLHLVEHHGTARALIELGADPDAFGVSQYGSDYGTCVFMAAANGKAETLKIMLPSCAFISGSWCWWAAKLGKLNSVKVLLEHGHFDLGFVKDGKTIAQAAFHAGHTNKTLQKKSLEILNELRVHGAPDEMPGALGPVYGKSF